MEHAREQADGDKNKMRQLQEDIKLYKYVGETSRSLYERSFEHLTDFESLSIKSHMLKHAVEMHTREETDKIKFGIRIIKTARTSFERQIYESVEIQENRRHHLLNSRSEYNRCAVPRLTCKLGDNAYKKYEKEIELEMANEEVQISKIREMIKERNRQRHHTKAPPPKRRKLGDTTYSNCTEETATNNPAEKRKPEDAENPPVSKKARTGENIDIREMFRRQEEDAKTTAEGPGDAQLDQPAAHYGELEEVDRLGGEIQTVQRRNSQARERTRRTNSKS